MSKKNIASIESAKIALYGTIIVAIIGIITAIVNSYSNYMSNKVQVELPIFTTQTAEARIVSNEERIQAKTQAAETTKSITSVIIQNLVNRNLLTKNSGNVVWSEAESAVYLVDGAVDSVGAKPTNFAPANFVFFSNVSWNSKDTELTACGINFRSNSLSSDYTTLLRRNGNVVLWLMSPNGLKEITSVTIQKFNTRNNDFNNLILVAEGARIILLVNDIVVYDVSDSTLTTGFVGKVVGAGSDDTNICTFRDSWLWKIE